MKRKMLMVPWDYMEAILKRTVVFTLPKGLGYENAKLLYVINDQACAAFGFVFESDAFEEVPLGCVFPRDWPNWQSPNFEGAPYGKDCGGE